MSKEDFINKELTMLPLSQIEPNTGQLDGLPQNPRTIKKKKFEKLKGKYLMPLDKKLRKQIAALAKPYPKSDDNWVKIDRSQFSHAQTTANN